jgi:predicted kinase
MPTLTILRGISGSGKSTWARNQNGVVVSRDDLRTALFGAGYHKSAPTRESEEIVTSMEHAAIKQALLAGKDVISDNTNLRPKFAQAIADIGYALGAEVVVKSFPVSLRVALAANRKRSAEGGRNVPEDIIRKQHGQMSGTSDWTPTEVSLRPYNGTPGKPKAFLFDLDGTAYHMNNKRGPYDHNVDVDDPDPVVQDIVNRLTGGGLFSIAMSGRKEATRERTEFSLERDDVWYDRLFMRADDDNRKDSIVKRDLFDDFVRDNFDVQFVLDARNQVVNMWRAMGLKCLQVAEGDF